MSDEEPVLSDPLELGLDEEPEVSPLDPAPELGLVLLLLPLEPVVPEPRVLLYAENSAALNLPL